MTSNFIIGLAIATSLTMGWFVARSLSPESPELFLPLLFVSVIALVASVFLVL